jgi:hypothetical protein
MCGLPLKAITASALCGIDAAKSAKGVNTDQNNMTKQQKTLVYKLATGGGGQTLQAILGKALRHHSKPDKRVENLGADGAEVRFIAYTRNNHQALIGVFHKLTKGRAQEVIEMIKDGDEWPVHLVTAKAAGKEAREFIEGTLFFGIWKNHVVVHQTSSCRADAFQEHLSWLLTRENADATDGGVPKSVLIGLGDPVPPSVRKKSKVPVRGITFGGCVATKVVRSSSKDVAVGDAKVSFQPTGRIWKALKEILVELKADVPEELLLDESLGPDDLKVFLKLSCSKKKAETTAGQLLGVLGHSLSHSDSEYTVKLADNTEIKGDIMKVRKNFGVECVDHHPVHENIFRCIIEYMRALVEDETIVEDEPFGSAK